MIEQLNIYGNSKVEQAIKRFQTFEPPEGYYLAFSGGKDSVVIKALADMAGVKYDAHYQHTSVDPPELIRFIKDSYPDVKIDFPRDKDGKRITMWNLIPKKSMPPTRVVRYCCQYLKEDGGNGRFKVTGVRWDESVRRRKVWGGLELDSKGKKEKLDPDNPSDEMMFRICPTKSSNILNPIIDWTTEEVWEFIHAYNIPYCKLYDEGYTRLGCIGCPMSSNAKEELERFPKYKRAYIKAFERMLEVNKAKGKETEWKTGEDVMNWWLETDKERKERRDAKSLQRVDNNPLE